MKPTTVCTPEAAEKVAQLAVTAIMAFRINTGPERDIQEAVATILDGAGLKYVREFEMGKANRIDFLIDEGVGLEVKVQGSPSAVVRQLFRYAEREEIKAMVVVSTRVRTTAILPERIRGKLVLKAELWRALL